MRVAGGLTAVLLSATITIVQPVATALTPPEIAAIAKQITVRIDGPNTGSGVIIERQGNVYTVLTCWHVVQLEGEYAIYTSDGKKQDTFNQSQVKQLPGVDLAVFQFKSDENYGVAEKGNSDQVALGTNISVAGYPQGTSDIDFRRGAISRLVTKPQDGYAFVYDIDAFPGMSGGAILNEKGKLVGIHGRATTYPPTDATTVYGIPFKSYLSRASSMQPVSSAPTPKPTNRPQPVNSNNSSSKFVLAKTLKSHSDSVNSVAFSPDGKTLASGSWDKTVKIWNVGTGQVIRTLNGHSNFVYSVAFSPDGKTLASGSFDNTIKIWNVGTGQVIRTLNGHSDFVLSVAFGHSDFVLSVAFSPDGKTLASGSRDKTVKIWNVGTGQVIRTLNGHSDFVLSVAFSPDGKTLASGSSDTTIKIWRLSE
ncbi:serine/threonine protein kinase [Mastigocladus laminosus UU774]|nr:serine/threonine protein kinase [Mastigocladus laminosus UU774]